MKNSDRAREAYRIVRGMLSTYRDGMTQLADLLEAAYNGVEGPEAQAARDLARGLRKARNRYERANA